MDLVEPGAAFTLEAEILDPFPSGYRPLAYLQSGLGFDVKRDMPGLKGARVEELYACGETWLKGGPINWS